MGETMRAIALENVGAVKLITCDKPTAGPYEVLVQMKTASLCTVEQRAYTGVKKVRFPYIGGHEGAGVIEAVGANVPGLMPGDHVVFDFIYCGGCENCKLGYSTQCTGFREMKPGIAFEGGVQGGTLAQYISIPWGSVYKIDSDIDFDQAALIEPLSCCLHSVNKTHLAFGETAVVIGAGVMGLLQAVLCKLRGARVIVSEPDAVRREKAVSAGIHAVIDPMAADPVEQVKALTGGRGADVVINTTPITAVWEQAIDMLAPHGRLIAYSSQHPDVPVGVSFGTVHGKESEFIGTVNPGAEDFVTATRMLAYKLINLEPFIEARLPFGQAAEAFHLAASPGSFRVVIRHEG